MTRSHIAVGGLDVTAEPFQQLISRFDWDLSLIEELEVVPGQIQTPPRCMVIDWEYDESREACRALRSSGTLPDIPVVAVVDDPWSECVADAFASGVDDFLPRRELGRLEHKIAALDGGGALLGDAASGKVVLVDPDRKQRLLLARQLRRMGFGVEFVLDATDIPVTPEVKLVVISAALDVPAALAARHNGQPWLVAGGREQLDRLELDGQRSVKLFDTAIDPAQIVFVANQLLTEEFKQLRRSTRVPYGVPISFSAGGQRTFGFTYNVSLGGLFVRTLTPPAMGTNLELHFRPPHGRGRVCVDGQLVWRQEQPVGGNGVPCGFGLQYGELSVADGAALEAGYNALLADNG